MLTKDICFATFNTKADGLKINLYFDNTAKNVDDLVIFKPVIKNKVEHVIFNKIDYRVAITMMTDSERSRFLRICDFFQNELKNQ